MATTTTTTTTTSDVKPKSPTQKKMKSSMSLKAKKFLATKTASSAMGQKAIQQLIGDQGTILLQTLKAAAERDVGASRAKELKQSILVLSLKAKLLFESDLIQSDDILNMVFPVNDAITKLHECLHSPKSNNKLKVELLAAKFERLDELARKILLPLISEKNLNLFDEMAKYYSSTKFLGLVIDDPKYSEEKQNLRSAIDILVAPLLQDYAKKHQFDECDEKGCENPRIVKQGDPPAFQGSPFCVICHNKMYQGLKSNEPDLRHFLVCACGKESELFKKEVLPHFPKNTASFFVAIENYKVCRLAVRTHFAEGVFEKYLVGPAVKEPVEIDQDIVDELKAAIDKAKAPSIVQEFKTVEEMREAIKKTKISGPPETIYDGCQAFIRKKMDAVFQSKFVETGLWDQYLTQIKLPAHLQPEEEE